MGFRAFRPQHHKRHEYSTCAHIFLPRHLCVNIMSSVDNNYLYMSFTCLCRCSHHDQFLGRCGDALRQRLHWRGMLVTPTPTIKALLWYLRAAYSMESFGTGIRDRTHVTRLQPQRKRWDLLRKCYLHFAGTIQVK